MRSLVVLVLSVVLVGCGKPTPQPDALGNAPENATPASDHDRLQGVWAIEWMDSGNGATEADVAKLASTREEKENLAREIERVRRGRIEFNRDKMSIALFGRRDEFTFSLDETQNPKVLKLTAGLNLPTTPGTRRSAAPPPREVLEWIYKFEGDTLVVAWMKGGKRPTEFKARRYQEPEPGKPSEPMIYVVTLKKTNTPAPPDPSSRQQTTRK